MEGSTQDFMLAEANIVKMLQGSNIPQVARNRCMLMADAFSMLKLTHPQMKTFLDSHGIKAKQFFTSPEVVSRFTLIQDPHVNARTYVMISDQEIWSGSPQPKSMYTKIADKVEEFLLQQDSYCVLAGTAIRYLSSVLPGTTKGQIYNQIIESEHLVSLESPEGCQYLVAKRKQQATPRKQRSDPPTSVPSKSVTAAIIDGAEKMMLGLFTASRMQVRRYPCMLVSGAFAKLKAQNPEMKALLDSHGIKAKQLFDLPAVAAMFTLIQDPLSHARTFVKLNQDVDSVGLGEDTYSSSNQLPPSYLQIAEKVKRIILGNKICCVLVDEVVQTVESQYPGVSSDAIVQMLRGSERTVSLESPEGTLYLVLTKRKKPLSSTNESPLTSTNEKAPSQGVLFKQEGQHRPASTKLAPHQKRLSLLLHDVPFSASEIDVRKGFEGLAGWPQDPDDVSIALLKPKNQKRAGFVNFKDVATLKAVLESVNEMGGVFVSDETSGASQVTVKESYKNAQVAPRPHHKASNHQHAEHTASTSAQQKHKLILHDVPFNVTEFQVRQGFQGLAGWPEMPSETSIRLLHPRAGKRMGFVNFKEHSSLRKVLESVNSGSGVFVIDNVGVASQITVLKDNNARNSVHKLTLRGIPYDATEMDVRRAFQGLAGWPRTSTDVHIHLLEPKAGTRMGFLHLKDETTQQQLLDSVTRGSGVFVVDADGNVSQITVLRDTSVPNPRHYMHELIVFNVPSNATEMDIRQAFQKVDGWPRNPNDVYISLYKPKGDKRTCFISFKDIQSFRRVFMNASKANGVLVTHGGSKPTRMVVRESIQPF